MGKESTSTFGVMDKVTGQPVAIGTREECDGKIAAMKLKEIHKKIVNVLKEFMDLKEEYYDLIAVWIIGTYCHKQFPSFPYLFFNAMKGSGKTRLLKIITALSNNAKLEASITESVLFRASKERTICLDEFENIGGKEKVNLRLLLNAGYKKGTTVTRMKKRKTIEGEEYVPEEFEVYCPIALANIWGMENVLSDRCITIILEKSSNPKITKLIENFDTNMDFINIKEALLEIKENINSFENIYNEWNDYQKNNYTNNTNYTNLTNTSNNINNTNTTNFTHKNKSSVVSVIKVPQNYIDIFTIIDKENLDGRDLELFLPLFLTANLCDKNLLKGLLETSKEMVKQRKKSDREDNKDVQLIEFISLFDSREYTDVTAFTNNFKAYYGIAELWVNAKWMGRALRRLNMVLKNRRLGKGSQVILDIDKAKEKIKMFKDVEPENE